MVASAVGGIPEIVVDGVTGWLVPFEAGGDAGGAPRDPAAFAAAIAERVNAVLADPVTAAAMGRAGRRRVLGEFGWDAVADRTVRLYTSLLGG